MALPPQQFCVRWNSYHTNLQSVFPRLLLTEQFADVTLACESRQLRCHKLVLSACSAYLERLLLQNPCKHPIVLMRDMRFSEMQALVDFMYKGEVNVTQEELPSLLKSAEALQIRGLCSSDNLGADTITKAEPKDFTVATEALVANVHAATNGPSAQPPPAPANGKKRRSSERALVKEETVEEDGLYYGELDPDHMDYNEDDETGKPGSSLGQTSGTSPVCVESATTDYALSNVQCQYDSPSDNEGEERRVRPSEDHTYDSRDDPPAYLIRRFDHPQTPLPLFSDVRPKIMTIGPGYPTSVNVIHVGDRPQQSPEAAAAPELSLGKRVRRSECVLRAAAACVSRGLTFQTASEQYNIPISTIRFFMARKGILPQRRRGRTTQVNRSSNSPEPAYQIQHFKLPLDVKPEAEEDPLHEQE